MPNGRTNNFPESGRGLGHVTPTIFDIQSNIIIFKTTCYRDFKFGRRLCIGNAELPIERTK